MYWCFYIVKAVDGMRVWRAEMHVCPLQCRLSLTLSVVIAVRQTVIILGRAPLGGKTRGGRRIMDALVFALSCFSSCLCRHPFLLTTLRSLVKTPLYLHWMTQPHYLRLSPFPSLSFSKLDLKKKIIQTPQPANLMVQQQYWLLAAWDKRLSSGQPCQLAVCCSTVFSVSRYLWLMPAALIIEQQIPLQFVALGASNSHFNYSPGQSMTELGRGERIQWGCLIKKKEKKRIDKITRHGYWRHESERTGWE